MDGCSYILFKFDHREAYIVSDDVLRDLDGLLVVSDREDIDTKESWPALQPLASATLADDFHRAMSARRMDNSAPAWTSRIHINLRAASRVRRSRLCRKYKLYPFTRGHDKSEFDSGLRPLSDACEGVLGVAAMDVKLKGYIVTHYD